MLSELLQDKGEFELKYTFPNVMSPAMASWLSMNCKIDKEYPESRIQSIYLETLNTESYFEKINSDFFKTKFRVRWYEMADRQGTQESSSTPFFLEKKMKIGAKRLKNRWVHNTRKDEADRFPLSSAYHQQWHRLFTEKEGEDIPHFLPFIQISYIRKRFVDLFSGARLSLDFDISVEKSNEFLLPPPTNTILPMGVFEVKSGSQTPPQTLHFLTKNLARKANFSKYERCISYLVSNS